MQKKLPTLAVHSWIPWIVGSIVLCGVLALGLAIFLLPVWSDTEWIKEAVMENMTEIAGGPIQMDTLNLHLFPTPALYVGNVSFEADEPDGVRFRAHHVEVEIGWQSLWEKQFVMTHVLLDQPVLTLDISPTETTDIPPFEEIPQIQGLVVRNGRLHLLRTVANQTTQAMNWENIQLTITQLQPEGPSQFQLSGQIPSSQASSSFNLNGTLVSLEPHEASSGNEIPAPIPGIKIHGQVEGSHLNLGEIVHFMSGHALEPPIQTDVNIQGKFSYTLQQEEDLLDIGNIHVSLNHWSFTGQGRLTDLFKETPRLDLSGSSSPIAIEQLSSLLPSEWIPEDVQIVLRDHHIAGTIELQQGTFHIPLNDDDHDLAEAQGIMLVAGGQFLPAFGQPLLTNISGTVAFSPSHIQISRVSGNIAPLTLTAPDATVIFEGDALQVTIPTFHIAESTWNLTTMVEFANTPNEPPRLTVEGSALPISLQHLSQIIPEPWLPDSVLTLLTERAIDGEIELLTGLVKWRGDEANSVISEGVIRLTKGHVLVDPNHPPLTNLSGGIVFESNLVRLVDVEATISASKMSVKEATLEWKDPDLWVDLQGEGLFSAQDIHQALLRDPRSASLRDLLSHYRDAQGHLRISTRIQGPVTNPSQLHILQGELLLADIHLSPTARGLPVHQLNGQFSFDDEGIGIQRFNGQIGESSVDMKGQWLFRKDSQSSNISIASRLSSTDLITLFPSLGETFSTLDGPIDSAMTLFGSALHPEYQAQFNLTSTTLTAKGVIHKPEGIPARIALKGSIQEGKAIRMTKGTLSIPPYTLEAKGKLSWSDPPSIRAFFQTESGTGAMFPKDVLIGDGRLHLSTLGIKWGLTGKSWDWTTWSMGGTIQGSNRISQSTTSNSKEHVQSVSLQWRQKDQTGKGEITLKEIPIESLIASQADSAPPLTGTTSLTTSLHMDIQTPEQMQHSVTGTGKAQIQKGLIQTGPVLSKILGILNVPSLLMGKVNLLEEGLPFDELTGSFSIENGLLTTKDLALKSPVIKLTAAGTYDLPTENLDSMIAVSPFGAYSNLLKDIPLFGSLMQGERKGFLTALFAVKGLRTNPEVTYLPLKSFAGGLKGFAQFPIDVLKNIITLPLPKKESTEHVSPAKE